MHYEPQFHFLTDYLIVCFVRKILQGIEQTSWNIKQTLNIEKNIWLITVLFYSVAGPDNQKDVRPYRPLKLS